MTRRIVLLGAMWCPTCKELYKNLVEEFGVDNIDYIDLDRYPHILSRYKIAGYPALAFIDSNELKYIETTLDLEQIRWNYKYMDELSISRELLRCPMKYGTGEIKREHILRIISNIERNFDWVNGGLYGEYKRFPFEVAEFMLRMYLVWGVDGYLNMIHKTIDIILQSKMFDYKRYMISRISYTPDWDDPDRIYLLEDQARFAKILMYIYLITKNKLYFDLARDMVKSINKYFLSKDDIYRAYIDDKPITPTYPHILYNMLSHLAEISIDREIARYTINLTKYFDDIESVVRARGYLYLGDLIAYGDASIKFYEAFRWSKGVRIMNTVSKIIDRLGDNNLYRDIDKSILKPLDNWRCIPFKENILLSILLHRYSIHIDNEDFLMLSKNIIELLDPTEIRDLDILSIYGMNLANHLYSIDKILIYGYDRVPSKVSQVFKPYILITYRDSHEKYVEYISKDFKFRM